MPWPGASAWCFTGCGGMAPSSNSHAKTRWRFGRHKRGCIPSAVSKERRKEPRLKVGDPPVSPRRDAVPDDARTAACLPNPLIAFEHAHQMGTWESFWTRHDVGSRRADHGRKRGPGDGHIRDRGSFSRPGTRCNRPTLNRCRDGPGSSRTTPWGYNLPQAPRLRERTVVSRRWSIENWCLTGTAPLRKQLSLFNAHYDRGRDAGSYASRWRCWR